MVWRYVLPVVLVTLLAVAFVEFMLAMYWLNLAMGTFH